jgi:hypothetical protein
MGLKERRKEDPLEILLGLSNGGEGDRISNL